MMAGIKLQHVPYRGESLAMTDLIGGQVQMVFATVGSSIQYIKGGKLRALAVTPPSGSPCLPDVPPLERLPSGLRGELLERPHRAEEHAGRNHRKAQPRDQYGDGGPEDQSRASSPSGGPPIIGSPADFGRIIADDTAKWAKVIQFSGAKAE